MKKNSNTLRAIALGLSVATAGTAVALYATPVIAQQTPIAATVADTIPTKPDTARPKPDTTMPPRAMTPWWRRPARSSPAVSPSSPSYQNRKLSWPTGVWAIQLGSCRT